MRITILGCGPSGGVPLVGCDCRVCRSPNPRNRRTRPSIMVEEGDTRVLVDTSPDLRGQMLAAGVSRFDAVLFTHDHADHTHGIDDLRSVNHHRGAALDVFGDAATLRAIRQSFGYAFTTNAPGSAWCRPHLDAHEISGPFRVGGIEVTPFEQGHGDGSTLGYRFGAAAYSTDTDALSEAAFAALEGVAVWVVDCLRPEPSARHSYLAQTLEWIARVRPGRAILTHMNHLLDYGELAASLPEGVEPAYDGLVVECPAQPTPPPGS